MRGSWAPARGGMHVVCIACEFKVKVYQISIIFNEYMYVNLINYFSDNSAIFVYLV